MSPLAILPKSAAKERRRAETLGALLCPYDGCAEHLLATDRYEVWGTSACVAEGGGIRARHGSGTSAFRVRAIADDLVLSTDDLGTCPLWFAETAHGVVASTEAKALVHDVEVELRSTDELLRPGVRPSDWSPFVNVRRVPPGATLTIGAHGARIDELSTSRGASPEQSSSNVFEQLIATLRDGLSMSREATGAFVSGGIDSSLACALARERVAQQRLRSYSLGTKQGNEFPAAGRLAARLDCQHSEVDVSDRDLLDAFDRVIFKNEVFDGLTAEILLQFSLLYDAASSDCEHIVTGYGSDLLFDGMLSVEPYMRAVGLESAEELVERTRWTGELSPFVAWSRGLSVEHVFWTSAFIDFALSIPRELCQRDGVSKWVLREAAVRSGLLPRELALEPKLGLSEGTGVYARLATLLGIDDPLDYRAKSLACVERLHKVFGSGLGVR